MWFLPDSEGAWKPYAAGKDQYLLRVKLTGNTDLIDANQKTHGASKLHALFCQENWRMAFEWRKIDASVIPLLSRILPRGGGKAVAFRVHVKPAFKALVLHACGAQRFVQIQVMLRRVNDAAGNIGAMV